MAEKLASMWLWRRIVIGLVAALAPLTGIADSVDDRVDALNELLKGLPTVVAERRADQVAVTGWTRDAKTRKVLDKVLSTDRDVIDLTSEDVADGTRMVEVDVIIVGVSDRVSKSFGFDFLNLVTTQFSYFTSYNNETAKPGLEAPGDFTTSEMTVGTHAGSMFHAMVDYNVNIANATDNKVKIIARPHLATLNGERAEFLAGGELVFKVSGLQAGRIQPYPFGIQLNVTPTILKTPSENGVTQVLLDVDAQRLSLLGAAALSQGSDDVTFDKVQIKSKAVVPMDETLILSGLYQREHRTVFSGVPILRSIPFIKYFFSNRKELDDTFSYMVFLSPREPEVLSRVNYDKLETFIQRRSAYREAVSKGGEAVEQFRKNYHDWYQPQANRYATHFMLLNRSDVYRELRGEDLRGEEIRRDIMSVWSADKAGAK